MGVEQVFDSLIFKQMDALREQDAVSRRLCFERLF